MKRMLAMIFGITMLLATLGAATASAGHEPKDGPGPNGHNNKGLCTAYFNGSDNGRANKRGAPPFQALEAAAAGEPGETVEQRVLSFCGGDENIGGNPDFSDPGEPNNNRGGNGGE